MRLLPSKSVSHAKRKLLEGLTPTVEMGGGMRMGGRGEGWGVGGVMSKPWQGKG